MKTVVIAALTAVLVTVGVLALRPAPPPSPPDLTAATAALQQQFDDLREKIIRRPVDVLVLLTQTGARCRTQSLPHGYAYRQQPVRWFILNINCNMTGREVEVRFADDATPLDVKRPRHPFFIRTMVRGDALPGSYKYALWSVGGSGDYQLEDPELEIAQF